MLCHPLVNAANAPDWTGAPLMWLACGQERMADGVKAVAQQAARDSVAVQFEENRAMPHLWPLTTPDVPQARIAFESWATACPQLRCGNFESSAKMITAERMAVVSLNLMSLVPFSQHQIQRLLREQRDQC